MHTLKASDEVEYKSTGVHTHKSTDVHTVDVHLSILLHMTVSSVCVCLSLSETLWRCDLRSRDDGSCRVGRDCKNRTGNDTDKDAGSKTKVRVAECKALPASPSVATSEMRAAKRADAAFGFSRVDIEKSLSGEDKRWTQTVFSDLAYIIVIIIIIIVDYLRVGRWTCHVWGVRPPICVNCVKLTTVKAVWKNKHW